MKRFTAFFLVLSLVTGVFAQEKKVLSIEDVSINYSLYARELPQCNWIPESDLYAYTKGDTIRIKEADGANYYFILLAEINENLGDAEQLKRLPYLRWNNLMEFSFVNNNAIYTVGAGKSREVNKAIELPTGLANLEYDLKTGNFSGTIGDDLHVNGKQINESKEGFVYGQTVHRNEFGIGKGTYWSNSFSKLAFYENNQNPVSDYPMLNITNRVATADMIKYPMAGGTNEIVKVGIYDTKTKKTIYLETGSADQYLTNLSWGPADKYLYIGVLNRGQDHLKWQQYDVSTGKLIKTLFEEKSESFVEPLNPLHFIPNRSNEFIWTTWKDGYTHFYKYNTDGKELKQITKGAFEVKSFEGFDASGKNIYFTSTEESPLETHLYKVSINGGKAKKITSAKGQHSVRISDKSNFIIDSYSSRTVAQKMLVLDHNGKQVQELHDAGNPMAAYEENGIEFGTIKAKDQTTDLYYRIIKPYNFDPSKKYPVIQYVYGGPHAQMISESWQGGASLFLHYMAQQGYIIFTIDNRGSDNRGAAFEQATFRQLGTIEMEDQLTGLDFIKSKNYVDKDRIGVHGWSFGGFMTTTLMLRSPGSFKVGVCGGPVIDWEYYEIMYTERYMGHPKENSEGYELANLSNHVDKLEGKLLIVQGADDDVVVWQHSLSFIDAAVGKAVLFDYFPYPGHGHHVRGQDRVHLQKYMAQYFIDNL